MLCDRGRKLYEEYEDAHRQLEMAERELRSEPANRTQSERRLGKVEEVEREPRPSSSSIRSTVQRVEEKRRVAVSRRYRIRANLWGEVAG